jgi:hypothetical protein
MSALSPVVHSRRVRSIGSGACFCLVAALSDGLVALALDDEESAARSCTLASP